MARPDKCIDTSPKLRSQPSSPCSSIFPPHDLVELADEFRLLLRPRAACEVRDVAARGVNFAASLFKSLVCEGCHDIRLFTSLTGTTPFQFQVCSVVTELWGTNYAHETVRMGPLNTDRSIVARTRRLAFGSLIRWSGIVHVQALLVKGL